MDSKKKRIIERRKYVRLALDANTKCSIEGHKEGKPEIVKCNNISPEGICITLKKLLKEGALVHVEIAMKDGEKYLLKGKVVWSKETYDNATKKGGGEFRTGIKILDISGDKNRFLLQLCDQMVSTLGQKYPKIKF